MIKHFGQILFSEKELECKCGYCGPLVLAPGFEAAARQLRLGFGYPMTVTSGGRCLTHNKAEGGHPRSLHVFDQPHWPTGGLAAFDIAMRDGRYNLALIGEASAQGWSVGINDAKKFIHLDRRIDHVPVWKGTEPTLFPY